MQTPLQELLHSNPRAAALISYKLEILDQNVFFTNIFSTIKYKNILGLAHGKHKDSFASLFYKKTGWRGIELSLGKNPTLYWCETHSLKEQGEIKHFLEIHPMEQLRALEAKYLHSIRRVPDDRLWIIDDFGRLLWTQTDDPYYLDHLDDLSEDLILEPDRIVWNNSLDIAKSKAGELINIEIRAAYDGQNRNVDICYIHGGIFGGRFYVASRNTEPSGSRIVKRLKEAWLVIEDAELAQKLNTKQSAISRANKTDSVPATWLIKTGKETGFSIDWLLSGQGSKKHLGITYITLPI